MQHVKDFEKFLEELNEKGRGTAVGDRVGNPIDEIKDKKGVGIFMLGPPASGKSTFVKQVILPVNGSFKTINTDDISVLVQKWKEEGGSTEFIPDFKPERGSSEKAEHYVASLIKGKNNFIFDTTGRSFNTTINLANIARDNGYKVIFVHVLVDLESALKRNSFRLRQNTQPPVTDDYIVTSHEGVVDLIKKYIKTIDWSYDAYYAVTTKNFELEFYRFNKNSSVSQYWNKMYIDTDMSVSDFYKKLNEGLNKYYSFDLISENEN